MIKYRAAFKSIEPVEVVRETDKCVWVKHNGIGSERRSNKISDYESWFDTWDEAKAHLVKIAEDDLNRARLQLSRAQGNYGNMVGLKNPEKTQ